MSPNLEKIIKTNKKFLKERNIQYRVLTASEEVRNSEKQIAGMRPFLPAEKTGN